MQRCCVLSLETPAVPVGSTSRVREMSVSARRLEECTAGVPSSCRSLSHPSLTDNSSNAIADAVKMQYSVTNENKQKLFLVPLNAVRSGGSSDGLCRGGDHQWVVRVSRVESLWYGFGEGVSLTRARESPTASALEVVP